jgi:hypothetical protein
MNKGIQGRVRPSVKVERWSKSSPVLGALVGVESAGGAALQAGKSARTRQPLNAETLRAEWRLNPRWGRERPKTPADGVGLVRVTAEGSEGFVMNRREAVCFIEDAPFSWEEMWELAKGHERRLGTRWRQGARLITQSSGQRILGAGGARWCVNLVVLRAVSQPFRSSARVPRQGMLSESAEALNRLLTLVSP